MSNIRVTYSGLLAFIVGLTSIFFGLFYSLIVTRSLSAEEFGTWSLIFNIVNYFLISELIISYWSTRQTARGEKIGKSSLISSFGLSIIAIPIFIAYVFLISKTSNANFEILILGAVLLPLSFLGYTLNGINLGHKPHAVSFGTLTFVIIKIPLVFLTVVILDMSVYGIVLTFFFALLAKIIVQIYFSASKIRTKLNYNSIRWCIKYSWLPLFLRLQNYVRLFDVALYPIIIGSVLGVAYYSVSLTIAAIVGQSAVISQAVYPKLLANDKFEGIKKNFDTGLFFAIPLLGITIIFSKPALFALNPIYQEAWPIVILFSFRVFIQSLQRLPGAIITGTEQIDTQKNPTMSQLVKSNLFYFPKISLIFSIFYIVILAVMLLLLKSSTQSEFEIVFFWAILAIIIEIPLTAYLWVYSRKYGKITFPVRNIVKYIITTTIMMLFFVFSSEYILNYEKSVYDFLPSLILELSFCIGIYLAITYLINSDTRKLVKSVLREFKKSKN